MDSIRADSRASLDPPGLLLGHAGRADREGAVAGAVCPTLLQAPWLPPVGVPTAPGAHWGGVQGAVLRARGLLGGSVGSRCRQVRGSLQA